ncbi:hypothetical protein JCM24511_03062 [Saitozyma sp. JCM 24511]|nr:hypothetical protein JCM24511_03062 [Saitozyma sp. JCM 24511]
MTSHDKQVVEAHEHKPGHAHPHNAHPGYEKHDHHLHEADNDGRILGGFKATLHNPNVSVEAKEHAANVLLENGASLSADKSR